MKPMIVIFTLCFVFMIGACSDGKPGKLAKESYLMLKKIEAKTEVGVNYREYAQAVGDAKYTINIFNESKEKTKNINIATSLNKIMLYYMLYSELWTAKINGSIGENIPSGLGASGYGADKVSLYNTIIELFPKLKQDNIADPSARYLIVKDVKQALWQEASLELKNISKLFE